jgi:Ni/Co efflux regulator RcnB
MTKSVVRTLKRIGLVSSAGLIAISASAFASKAVLAAAPAASGYQQIPPDQQPQKNQQKAQKNGQPQQKPNQPLLKNEQSGQPPQPAQNQRLKTQQNGQQWNQQNGQAQSQQGGQQWNQQNGQPQSQQNGQQWNQQNGQPQYKQIHRYDWTAYQPGHRPPQWQQHRRDFNPRPYQWNRTSNQRYHYQHYVQPRGWYYQRWVYGQILPSLFWGRDYWLANYYGFGLIDPPYGYVWVRNGDDALLVDVENGQILSVEYGVFYS